MCEDCEKLFEGKCTLRKHLGKNPTLRKFEDYTVSSTDTENAAREPVTFATSHLEVRAHYKSTPKEGSTEAEKKDFLLRYYQYQRKRRRG